MKKIIGASAIILLLSITATGSFAQQASAPPATSAKAAAKEVRKEKRAARQSAVSDRSLQQFASDFPGATQLSATRPGIMDKISFRLDGVNSDAYYDQDANLIGTVTVKSVNDLPAAGLKAIAKQYKGYTIGKVILFDDNEANDTDMILYGQQFADADNYFAELKKDGKTIVVQITMAGEVFFFRTL
jgi:hypothetical protein